MPAKWSAASRVGHVLRKSRWPFCSPANPAVVVSTPERARRVSGPPGVADCRSPETPMHPEFEDPEWPVTLVDGHGAAAYAAWWAGTTGQPWRRGGCSASSSGRRRREGWTGGTTPWGDVFDPSWVCVRASHPGRPQVIDSYPVDLSVYGSAGSAALCRTGARTPSGSSPGTGTNHQGCGSCFGRASRASPGAERHGLARRPWWLRTAIGQGSRRSLPAGTHVHPTMRASRWPRADSGPDLRSHDGGGNRPAASW